MGLLRDYLPRHTYGVVGAYQEQQLTAAVAAVSINDDDTLGLQFPGNHAFQAGDRVTVQLDNRLQMARLSEELPVHRTSYKGVVSTASADFVEVTPAEFQLAYSDKFVEEYRAPDYRFPPDPRPLRALEESPDARDLELRGDDAETNLGVLLTRAPDRPHSTVMAFLSARSGDVFLVTRPQSYKGHNLFRDARVVFAVDYRETYDLTKPLNWAYRLQAMKAYRISAGRRLHTEVTEAFLRKNPWNARFFAGPDAMLLHLAPVVT